MRKGSAFRPTMDRLQTGNSGWASILGQLTDIREIQLQEAATVPGLSRARFNPRVTALGNAPKPVLEH